MRHREEELLMVAKADYTQCTFNVDNELARKLPGVVIEMKQRGCKRFSKTLVINAMVRHFLELHRSGDIETIEKLMSKDYKKITGMKLDAQV